MLEVPEDDGAALRQRESLRVDTGVLEPAAQDWRNSTLFFFDLAMVLRGLAGAARLGLIETDPRLVERISELLWRLVADDGMFDACMATRIDAALPDRWSTRRGPFLSKAAGGVLIAAAGWLGGLVPLVLLLRWTMQAVLGKLP